MGRADSPLRDRMIFVVGAPRSGTHWLQRIVTAHPDVGALPSETFLFSEAGLGPLFDRFHHGALESPQVARLYADRDVLLDAARDLCDRVFAPHLPPGVRFLSERTPLHGDYVRLLTDVYPDARIAHIVRDGRDVARSLLAQRWGTASVEEAARTWAAAVRSGRAAARQDRYVEVRYERLLADPTGVVRAVFDGLGIATSHEALDAGVAEAREHQNVDPSAPQAAQGKWRETFVAEDLHAFDRVSGGLLAELGYGPDEAAERPSPLRSAIGERARSARARAWKLARRPRRRARSRPERGDGERELVRILDALLGAVHDGRADLAGDLLEPEAAVRIAGGSTRRDLHGAAARTALEDALGRDVAMRGRQVRGDVLVGVGSVTAVVTYERYDGSHADRVLVLTGRNGRIRRLSLHQLPARPPAS